MSERTTRRLQIGVLVVLALAVVCVGIVAGASISLSVDAPEDPVEPGGETTVRYELTNTGEPTSALGLNLTVPDGVTADLVESDERVAADDRNSVFWTEPVESSETVEVTFTLIIDEDVEAETKLIEAEIHASGFNTSDFRTTEQTELRIATEEDDTGGESTDDSEQPDTDTDDSEQPDTDTNDSAEQEQEDGDGFGISQVYFPGMGLLIVGILYLGYRRLAGS